MSLSNRREILFHSCGSALSPGRLRLRNVPSSHERLDPPTDSFGNGCIRTLAAGQALNQDDLRQYTDIAGQVVYDGLCQHSDDTWNRLVKAAKTDCGRPIAAARVGTRICTGTDGNRSTTDRTSGVSSLPLQLIRSVRQGLPWLTARDNHMQRIARTVSGNGHVLAILFIVASCAAASEPSIPQSDQVDPGIHTLKRTLIVRPSYETGALEASSALTISNASGRPLSTVPVILYHMLEVTEVRAPDGKPLRFTQPVVPMADIDKMLVRHVQIALDEPLLPSATISLTIEYRGKLAGYAEAGLSYVKDHVSREFTIIRPDCLAYPVVSYPSRAALVKSMLRDFRQGWDYVLEVTVPEQFVVANGGKLLGTTHANGEVTYSYRNIRPAWRIDACIAKYGVLENEGRTSRVFFLPEHKVTARVVSDALAKSTELFSEWFGPLPQFEGFSVIEVPGGYGSQTDVTCILQEAEAFQGDLHALYHEVSHLWNPPSREPIPSRFESEGLACFLEYLAEERLDDKAGSLKKGLAFHRERFRAQCRRNPKLKDIPVAEYGTEDCTDASYTKGAIAFWVLYRLVGEQTFIGAYRRFCQEYRSEGATLADFVTTVKSASRVDLQKFFDEWIYGTQSSHYLLGDLSLEQIVELYIVEQ